MKPALTLAVPVLVAASVACSLLVPVDGYSGGPPGEITNSDGGVKDAGLIPKDAEGSPTDGGTADADADAGRCPRGVGPTMVEVTSLLGVSYCVDSTEVSQAQYQQFLKAMVTGTVDQGPLCSWNTTFAPTTCGSYDPATKGDLPVNCVNWCQARAFCEWNGKRLCGKIGGGPLSGGSVNDPTKDQWSAACSANGTRSFPYGASYAPTACNTKDREAGAPWPVGSQASCQGGQPGLFDMSGNVAEWQDACSEKPDPALGDCPYRGGTFGTGQPDVTYLRCDNGGIASYQYASRVVQGIDIGFRCCAD